MHSKAPQQGNKVFKYLANCDSSELLEEIKANDELWTADTGRQDKIKCQRDTQTIFIRTAKKPFPDGCKGNDARTSKWTKNSTRFPVLKNWLEGFAKNVGGELARVFIVKVKPNGSVYEHIDRGSYYASRDRYHLIVSSNSSSKFTCGEQEFEVGEGDLFWFDNKTPYEDKNQSDEHRIHVIVDILPLTVRPRPSSQYKHFEKLEDVSIEPMLDELEKNNDLWLANTKRQSNIRVQRETNNISLRNAVRPRPGGIVTNDMHPSCDTELAQHFPLIYGFAESFAERIDGELSRLTIVRLNPQAQVYPHIDHGEYYLVRDRYHLVLSSPLGSEMICGDEKVIFRNGELWWFDNKAPHEAFNNSDQGRVHLIFDVKPNQRSGKIWERTIASEEAEASPKNSIKVEFV
jgi:uncharacterized RmlC-like cupin family protein